MVPTLCVGTHSGTLRVPATQSVANCMPTQSVGTISGCWCARRTLRQVGAAGFSRA